MGSKLIFIAAVSLPASAYAAEWSLVGHATGMVHFVDKTSVKREGDRAFFTLLQITEKQVDGHDVMVADMLVNCPILAYKIVEGETRLGQRRVASIPPSPNWVGTQKYSADQETLENVCEGRFPHSDEDPYEYAQRIFKSQGDDSDPDW